MKKRRRSRPLASRFYDKILIGHGCWEWTGCINNHGYGKIMVLVGEEYKAALAHRVSWFLETGSWPERNVLHECDNPKCVRPDHLFLGNQLDNVHDCISKGRFRNGRESQTKCKRGHDLSGTNVYLKSGRRYCRACRTAWKKEHRHAAQ